MKITANASYGVYEVVATTAQPASDDFRHLDDVLCVDESLPTEKVVSYLSIKAFMASSLL